MILAPAKGGRPTQLTATTTTTEAQQALQQTASFPLFFLPLLLGLLPSSGRRPPVLARPTLSSSSPLSSEQSRRRRRVGGGSFPPRFLCRLLQPFPFPLPPFFQGLAPATDRPWATASEKRQLVRREITPPHSSPPPTHTKLSPTFARSALHAGFPFCQHLLWLCAMLPSAFIPTPAAQFAVLVRVRIVESCLLEVTGGGPSDRGKATCVWALMRSRLRLGFVAKKEVDYVFFSYSFSVPYSNLV